MTKRIERSRIESGKVDLPRKLHFLVGERVDFLAVIDRDGEYSVELPVAALSRLVKAKGELKALKGEQKSASAGHASALQAEMDSHAETRAALSKVERQLKALRKKVEDASSTASAAPAKGAAADAKPSKEPKAKNGTKPNGKAQPMTPSATASPSSEAPAESAPEAVEATVPQAPRKVSPKTPTAKAAEEVVAPPEPGPGSEALESVNQAKS